MLNIQLNKKMKNRIESEIKKVEKNCKSNKCNYEHLSTEVNRYSSNLKAPDYELDGLKIIYSSSCKRNNKKAKELETTLITLEYKNSSWFVTDVARGNMKEHIINCVKFPEQAIKSVFWNEYHYMLSY